MPSPITRLLDAQTVQVGWINHSATDCYVHTRCIGDVVNLGSDGAGLLPSQLLISQDDQTRTIWSVHLAGWQALRWELQPDATASAPEPEPPVADPAPGGEALLAAEPPNVQAMTKAQIVDDCSAVHGVELDGSPTKAELIEQALHHGVPALPGSST